MLEISKCFLEIQKSISSEALHNILQMTVDGLNTIIKKGCTRGMGVFGLKDEKIVYFNPSVNSNAFSRNAFLDQFLKCLVKQGFLEADSLTTVGAFLLEKSLRMICLFGSEMIEMRQFLENHLLPEAQDNQFELAKKILTSMGNNSLPEDTGNFKQFSNTMQNNTLPEKQDSQFDFFKKLSAIKECSEKLFTYFLKIKIFDIKTDLVHFDEHTAVILIILSSKAKSPVSDLLKNSQEHKDWKELFGKTVKPLEECWKNLISALDLSEAKKIFDQSLLDDLDKANTEIRVENEEDLIKAFLKIQEEHLERIKKQVSLNTVDTLETIGDFLLNKYLTQNNIDGDALNFFMENNVSPNSNNQKKQTPVHILAQNRTLSDDHAKKALEILIQYKADLNALDSEGYTALDYAAAHSISLVENLMNHEAAFTEKALFSAVEGNNVQILKLLLINANFALNVPGETAFSVVNRLVYEKIRDATTRHTPNQNNDEIIDIPEDLTSNLKNMPN